MITGAKVLLALTEYIHQHHVPVREFFARNIWRMKQFYENTKRATVLT